MESAFIDIYFTKIKLFKKDIREDFEGEYTFTERIGVIDNTVEIKDTTTECMIVETEETKYEEDDFTNHHLRDQRRNQGVAFDPSSQISSYDYFPLIWHTSNQDQSRR